MQIYHAVFAEITGLSETLHPSRTQNTHPTNLIFEQCIDQLNPCGGFELAYAQGFSFFSTIFPNRGVFFSELAWLTPNCTASKQNVTESPDRDIPV